MTEPQGVKIFILGPLILMTIPIWVPMFLAIMLFDWMLHKID